MCVCFSFIWFNQDGPTIYFCRYIAYLPSSVVPPGRQVTILAVTGLAAALGVSWFYRRFDQHRNPLWTSVRTTWDTPKIGLQFLLANKIDDEQGKNQEIINVNKILVNRDICVPQQWNYTQLKQLSLPAIRDPLCILGLSLASPQAAIQNLDKPH